MRVYLFFLLLALDLRGLDTGGSAFQYALFAANFALGAIIVFSSPTTATNTRSYALLALLLTCAAALLPQAYWSNPIGSFTRVMASYILMLLAFWVVRALLVAGQTDRVFKSILWAGILSIPLTTLNGVILLGAPLIGGRYFTISPATVPAFAVAMVCLAMGRYRYLATTTAALCIASAVMNGTRSLVLILAAVGLFAALATSPNWYSVARRGFVSAVVFLAVGVSTYIFASGIAPEATEVWIDRLTASESSGVDLTTETRLAEIDGQLAALNHGILSMIIGRGFGAEYEWTGPSFEQVRRLLGPAYEGEATFEAGHNFWIYSVFAQGYIIGLFIPVTICLSFLIAFVNARTQLINPQRYCALIGLVGLFGFLVSTIGGNPLGPRYSAFLYGAMIAIATTRPSLATQGSQSR